jgi:hypothetical protein
MVLCDIQLLIREIPSSHTLDHKKVMEARSLSFAKKPNAELPLVGLIFFIDLPKEELYSKITTELIHLGAQVEHQFNDKITHFLTNKTETNKVRQNISFLFCREQNE